MLDTQTTTPAPQCRVESAAEEALRDIIKGCDMMLQVEQRQAVRGFINEVKRVAQAGLTP